MATCRSRRAVATIVALAEGTMAPLNKWMPLVPPVVIKKREANPSEIPAIYELVGAQLPNRNPHRCFVKDALKEGPQGCLVVQPQDKGEIWYDALILVPYGAPRSPVRENLVYPAALGLIQTAYRKKHADLVGEFFEKLCNDGFESRVFTQKKLEELVANMRGLAETARTQGVGVAPNEIKKLIDCFEDDPPEIWNPVELCGGFASTVQFKDDWAILQKWPTWDEKKMLCSECAKDFYKTPYVSRKQIDALRKRLKYLKLPLWVLDREEIRKEKKRLWSLVPKAVMEAIRDAGLKRRSFTIK